MKRIVKPSKRFLMYIIAVSKLQWFKSDWFVVVLGELSKINKKEVPE